MAALSPPKPWEKVNNPNINSHTSSSTPVSNPQSTDPPASSATSSQPPALPSKPSSLSTVVNRTASNYSPYNATNRYGNTGYSTAYSSSPYSTYSSPYSRFGGSYGGGYGSMYAGNMYGGLNGGMGGMYGGGLYGQPGSMIASGIDPNDPNSLTNSFSQNTQATFQIIENLVGAFGGVAQMLESTYMATHQSFFAMISVAEQFTTLRTTLGSILGIFTLMRYVRTLISKITGRPPPADATSLTPSAFASFQELSSSGPNHLPNGQPVPSKKPFLIFLAAIVGLPYLMSKFIRSLAAQTQKIEQANEGQLILGPDGQPLPDHYQGQQRQLPIDPSKLEFCRVLYDYPPPSQPSLPNSMELSVKADELVVVLSKTDPMGNPSEWWQCRTRNHNIGYLPGVYLKPFVKRPLEQIETHSRVNTLSSVIGESKNGADPSRANSLKVEAKGKENPDAYK